MITAILAAALCGYAVYRLLRWAIRADQQARQDAELDWAIRAAECDGRRLLALDRTLRCEYHLRPKERGT